eukprot:CAMPEP_0116565258 /NCGR_PEP_ID=MMETSP0397-20121206/13798_1 /TAXON_ID=216820 /ORGANISM="Cyclophora tenuis, Strain ECT3854" /LENGTH=210 /DNA_ID=CAMNT_0004092011 /DNA_START=177 /DNA_END=806 /DNA_ORIENTATION=+
MAQLRLYDKVWTGPQTQFSTVYSFGHINPTREATFLQLHLSDGHGVIELSEDHMVFVEDNRAVPASWLVKNRNSTALRMASGELVRVEQVRTVERRGVFAPFTTSGTIVVNGVLASSYVAFQQSPTLKVGAWTTPMTYQWLAHVFESPHRMVCNVLLRCKSEWYTSDGVSVWVAAPREFTVWMMDQESPLRLILIAIVSAPLLPLFLVCW